MYSLFLQSKKNFRSKWYFRNLKSHYSNLLIFFNTSFTISVSYYICNLLATQVGSRPGILYSSGRINKESRNGLPPFYPIHLAIDTYTYNLTTLLPKFLRVLTTNEYSVIDSFYFPEEIGQQNFNLHMASLDVDSLFTIILLDKAVEVCVDIL